MNINESARPLGSLAGHQKMTRQESGDWRGNNLADRLLARLDGVTPAGPDQWMALCPAHDDRSPSLSVRDTEDRLLINCFAGCRPEAVVAAIGLTMADLFAAPAVSHLRAPVPRTGTSQFPRRDLEAALQHELLVLAQVVGNRVSTRQLARDTRFRVLRPEWAPFPDGFWERELQAARRIRRLVPMVYGAELDKRYSA